MSPLAHLMKFCLLPDSPVRRGYFCLMPCTFLDTEMSKQRGAAKASGFFATRFNNTGEPC